MNIDEYEASKNGGQPDAEIETALEDAPAAIEDPTPDPESDPPEPEATPEPEPEVIEPEATPAEPEKKVQTPEENARFAEERRERQAEERAQKALEKLKESDPAFQAAKLLEELYGAPISQIQAQLQRARMEQIAQREQIPVEAVERIENEKRATEQARNEAAQAGQELVQIQFAAWEARMGQEGSQLKQQYTVLSDEDIESAKSYILNTARNPNLPLEQAVMAVHGAKITEAIKQNAKTEALAELSGRKNTPIPPQGGKPTAAATLTDTEKYFAKQMGLTEEEYIKWR